MVVTSLHRQFCCSAHLAEMHHLPLGQAASTWPRETRLQYSLRSLYWNHCGKMETRCSEQLKVMVLQALARMQGE